MHWIVFAFFAAIAFNQADATRQGGRCEERINETGLRLWEASGPE